MFGLVDCDSFYASAEVVFRPDLRDKPVVVLSNDDGCIIALNRPAKALGIPKFEPYFKVKSLIERHQAHVFSSNFRLYGDLSARVMNTLQVFSPSLEVYSIDEMFLQLDGLPETGKELGHRIKKRVWQHVRIPVGVGIAPTKTLAKVANKAAKTIPKCAGVCVLDEPHKWEWMLRRLPVTEIWGIGKRMARRLADLGIQTGWDLAVAHPKTVRRRCNINVERTIEELNGRSCLELEEVPPDKKQIYCTRSFGTRASILQPIQEAVALYASRAVDKLRLQKGPVSTIHVFLHTSPFEPNYYSASTTAQLPYPTDDVRLVAGLARRTVAELYKPGREYVKAGIGLIEIQGRLHHQFDCLHDGQSEQADRVMSALDAVKRRYGKEAIFLASQGIRQPWAMRQNFRSPEYTTHWSDLPVVS